MTVILSLVDVEVRFAGLTAVRSANCEMTSGTVVGITGPNSAGKSTLLSAISGRVPASRGRVSLGPRECSVDLGPYPPEERLRTFGVFHSPEAGGVFGSLTVEENLLLAPRLLKHAPQQTRSELASVYSRFPLLAERRRLPARFLSGGWRQVLSVCRAHLAHPRFLLSDEPFLGLSPRMTRTVADLLLETKDLDGAPAGLLLTDQREERLRPLCHHLLQMGRGLLSPGTRPERSASE